MSDLFFCKCLLCPLRYVILCFHCISGGILLNLLNICLLLGLSCCSSIIYSDTRRRRWLLHQLIFLLFLCFLCLFTRIFNQRLLNFIHINNHLHLLRRWFYYLLRLYRRLNNWYRWLNQLYNRLYWVWKHNIQRCLKWLRLKRLWLYWILLDWSNLYCLICCRIIFKHLICKWINKWINVLSLRELPSHYRNNSLLSIYLNYLLLLIFDLIHGKVLLLARRCHPNTRGRGYNILYFCVSFIVIENCRTVLLFDNELFF